MRKEKEKDHPGDKGSPRPNNLGGFMEKNLDGARSQIASKGQGGFSLAKEVGHQGRRLRRMEDGNIGRSLETRQVEKKEKKFVKKRHASETVERERWANQRKKGGTRKREKLER